MLFMSPTWGPMSLAQVMDNLQSFIAEDAQAQYKVIIGTDSQTNSQQTLYVTALIVQRMGRGARFFFKRHPERPMRDLTYRIYKETELSLQLIDLLQEQAALDLERWPHEIHIDIGAQGETKSLIQEVVGWVTSIGHNVQIKPHSYGASAVADRFTS